MPVDAAARRHRGAAAAAAGARTPRNAEVETAPRSAACARGDEPRDGARGAASSEGLQQAVAGVNAMADGASGEACVAAPSGYSYAREPSLPFSLPVLLVMVGW